jgi:hypothetical protein
VGARSNDDDVVKQGWCQESEASWLRKIFAARDQKNDHFAETKRCCLLVNFVYYFQFVNVEINIMTDRQQSVFVSINNDVMLCGFRSVLSDRYSVFSHAAWGVGREL